MLALGYLLAVLIGISLGLLGGGGSILTVPVLLYCFGYGMKTAVPMSLVVVGLTSLFGVVRHGRAGNVAFRAAFAFGPLAIVGAFAGAALALGVSGRIQTLVFGIVMLAASLAMLRGRSLLAGRADAPHAARRLAPMMLLGGIVGMLTGFVGVGGGFLYVPALVLAGGVAMKRAVGTSLVLITLSSAAGLAMYAGTMTLPWMTVAGFTLLAVLGVAIGSALVHRISQGALRKGFAVFVLLMGVLVLWQGEGRTRAPERAEPVMPARD